MRLEGWERRLDGVIAEWRGHSFSWGVSDCIMFVADAVRAVRCVDLFADWRNAYTTPDEARNLLADRGVSMTGEFDRLLGARKSWEFARRGDVGMILSPESPFGLTAAVVQGERCLAPMASGLAALRCRHLHLCWSV